MLAKLLLLFIVVPLVELAILVQLGTMIGFWPTIGLVVATGFAGAWLAKSQGFRAFAAIQTDLREGRTPAEHLLDGLLILVGGVVLLTPGLLSDIAGILLLLPPSRRAFKNILRRRLNGMVRSGQVTLFVR